MTPVTKAGIAKFQKDGVLKPSILLKAKTITIAIDAPMIGLLGRLLCAVSPRMK